MDVVRVMLVMNDGVTLAVTDGAPNAFCRDIRYLSYSFRNELAGRPS